MRTALKTKAKARGAQVSTVKSYPAPVGGWNARDALANMKPTDAVRLVNWFPRTTDCVIRGGHIDHMTGFDEQVETLAVYNGATGLNKMFAVTDTAIYDASTFGFAANYLELPGASGDYASTPDSAALDITGDLDLRAFVALDDWTPTTGQMVVAKWESAPQLSYALSVITSGLLRLDWADDLGGLTAESTVRPTASNGQPLWVRVTLDVDAAEPSPGLFTAIVTFYTSEDGDTWGQLGAEIIFPGITTGNIFVSTSILEVGSCFGGTSQILNGRVYQSLVYDGIDGALVASMVADDTTAGDTSFPSSLTGETWTVNGSAAIVASTDVTAGITDARWQWVNMGDGTNNYLLMFNGADEPQYYNGTTWISVDGSSSPALTGIATTELIAPMVYQGRLFIIQKNSLSVWYLAAGAVGGALTKFDFSSIFSKGGFLMAHGTWSFDGGDGPDDYAAFLTSEGEVAIYRGTNPSSAATWVKVGTYFLGQPIGRRCLVSFGGDLIAITQNGAFPLSQALQSATIDYRTAVTNKIENAFNDAARQYGSNFGWEATIFPAHSAIVFNVPTSPGVTAEQYVMNTITKSWCRFDSWNANTFAIFNGELYFAGDGVVCKAWTGTSDNGDDIVADGKTAFSYFGETEQNKVFKLFRPMLQVNGPISFLTGLDINFDEVGIVGTATYNATSGALWDVALWDEALWAATLTIVQNWTSPQPNFGNAAAGKLKIATNALTVAWMSSDYVYEAGGIL